MKKIAAMLLSLCILVCCTSALASTDARVIEKRIATRTGPGTKYTEPGSFLYKGAEVTVHTKVWDSRNEIYWVQVEFTSAGERYRAYTGDWRLDVDLNYVPYEIVEADSWLNYDTFGYAGPGYDYHYYGGIQLYGYGSCRVIEVENNFALVETSASSHGLTRAWVPLNAVACGSEFYGRDTFTGHYPSWDYGDDDGGATLLPGDDSPVYIDPVGQYVTVWVSSGNARSGPGTTYDFVQYVHEGDRLQVLASLMGNTGKDWYQVRINGRLCWLSSGLVTFNGNSEGTAYGVPIIPDDPFAEYPQASTHLIGRLAQVTSTSAHVREEPNTDTPTIGYVHRYDCFEILDCRIGSTGKVWYKISINGEYGWISSGLTILLGY